MNAMQKVFVFIIVTTYVSPCSGVPTLQRLDRRVSALENDLHDETKYRQEDVQHLTSMIDYLEESVQSKHGTFTDLQANSYGANMAFFNIINKAFSDEKMMNSRTRRKVADVEKSISEFANMASSSTNIQTQLNIIVETLKHQLEIISELQRNQVATIGEISTLQHKHNDSLQEMATLHDQHNSILIEILTSRQNNSANIQELIHVIENGRLEKLPYNSCKQIHANGHTTSGSYQVNLGLNPASRPLPITVYCDMETDGGGWTVFQRRKEGSEDFYRTWSDYEQGFGHLDGEFWLGNMYLSQLTRQCCHELRIDLEDFDGNRRYAKYSKFQIGSTDQNYVLTADGYSGDAGDSLAFQNGSMFSTKDRDNDKDSQNCAQSYKGGWWYNSCHHSNLNGLYYKEGKGYIHKGVIWRSWLGLSYSLKYVDMKFR